MKKVCVITGSRAEYGAVSSFLKEVALSDKIKIQLIVTGMHLSKEFGFTYKKIEEDGYKIDKKIDIDLSKDDDVSIVNSTAKGMMGIVDSISNLNPDMIFIVGDRYEIFAAAFSAAMLKVPIAHCAGGETTLGATDEFIRHSITKMSWWHFVANEDYKKRVLQLGESKKRVFNVGALGLDLINEKLLNKKDIEKEYNFEFGERNLIITFHPTTLEKKTSGRQFDELIKSLKTISNTNFIFTSPNSDSGGKIIEQKIDLFVKDNFSRSIKIKSMGSKNYLSTLQYVDGVVGNSSSGLVEAPSFFIGTVNIGDRQTGRMKSKSVVDCKPNELEITKAIYKILSKPFRNSIKIMKNPYGDGRAAKKIVSILEDLKLPTNLKKDFIDL
ncbi:MAG: UDP-N-acetylglucosamine 2-epimerase (hydrolyzing) [Legionellales bacterium]|mgnify:CR=1 FL=1|nr:UDP-N-acetylglucosamine 2-epimerase (hydrolyzing) [Legionellales bacterium]|tara:strand:+ start:1415 stop:2566 length:1152 start_codon:yes stop_codon:yes gene_type:complete